MMVIHERMEVYPMNAKERPNGQRSRPTMEQFSVRFDDLEMGKLRMLMAYFHVSRVGFSP